MAPRSAGVLLYAQRFGTPNALRVLLAHPGGPFFAKKEFDVWSVPKGLVEPDEELFAAARREFEEETGLAPPPEENRYHDLGEVRYKSGKRLHVWACAGDCDAQDLRSNTFPLEWPPRSGRMVETPEVDRFAWFELAEAETRLLPAQRPLLHRLARQLLVGGLA